MIGPSPLRPADLKDALSVFFLLIIGLRAVTGCAWLPAVARSILAKTKHGANQQVIF